MTWDVEAHPSTVIADVPTISAGDRHLTTEGLYPSLRFRKARHIGRGILLPSMCQKRAKGVKHLVTAADST